MPTRCVFCDRVAGGTDLLLTTDRAVAFADGFPLTPGHTLIVPRRHEPDFFALDADEQDALWHLLRAMRDRLEQTHRPDGYNVGVNVGTAAGQTVGHVHIH